ncbi:MAG: DUF1127 domain-containing protein [Rhodospirillum sp.]|nr:DUF1127 domain-containing protein [Rhodospirillum sp.]MCF8491575.1 DUF1127 domain-containing protein [Rhodospirillum sp.]MCF8500915.1 DUF1127 domain-containing protein [Rhodospirillum sp.]
MATTTSISHNRLDVFALFGQMIAHLRVSLAQWRAFRRTYDELNTMSDAELDDLDMRRCDLRDIAWRAVRGQ